MAKKIIFCYLLATSIVTSCNPQTIGYKYDAECSGVGSNNSYLVKIYTYGKSIKKARNRSLSHAVHAVLFKGISGSGLCQSQKPLCNISYSDKKEWFDNFFESGDYLQYVSFSNNGYVDANDVVKIKQKSLGKYRVGVSVIIMKNALRKKMEKEGFARPLNQGF